MGRPRLTRRNPPAPDVWTLFDTNRAGNESLDAYLRVVLARCAEWFQASGASIFLHVDGSDRYALAAKSGHESSVPDGAAIQRGVGIAGTCIETREPILLENPLTHPALAHSVTRRNRKLGSSIVVPLLTPDRDCIGVLNLSRTQRERTFTPDDLRYARSLAGHIAMAVANARLMSKLRHSADEAVQLHAKLDRILSSLAIGVIVLDGDGTVSHMNPEAVALAGADGSGSSFETLASAAQPAIREALRKVQQAAAVGERSSAAARNEEVGRAYSLTGSPLPGGGATLAIQDTSEHDQAMREVSRVRRLAEIGQMTAMIAHEIRNPLYAMRGAAQVIQSDPSHALEFGKIIEDEVIKLNEMCNGFLDFARPLDLHVRPVDLATIAARVAERQSPSFVEKGVELTVDAAPGSVAAADPDRIEQVVLNLVLNALQACEPGDRVTIRVRPREIAVQDSGPGMEQSSLERLFTPFFTTKAGGSGLGLSTVRKIVDAHEGTIEVESKPGQGTCFRVGLTGQAA